MSNQREPLEPGLITAAAMLEWRRSRGAVPDLGDVRGVILTHQGSVTRALTPRFRAKTLRDLSTELRLVRGASNQIAVAGPGVGAPATAILVEELAALGVRSVIALDIAGSLDTALPSGSAVLARSAICGDGTSPHYAPNAESVSADDALADKLAQALTSAGIAFTNGAVWTTDAPFRETPAEVARFREHGASVVDMETAALYAAGAATGVSTAAMLVVADELFDGWRPPADMARITATLQRVAAIATGCLLA